MRDVVIAGGAASLGRSMVQGILTLAPSWKPIVLSRVSSRTPAWLSSLVEGGEVELRHVDYTSHDALVSALRGAHTVISVLITDSSTWTATQIALLHAAKAAGAHRFAPSEFGIGIGGTPQVDWLAGNLDVWKACEESGLEWTRFENGLFMNYLGFAAPADRRDAALAGREKDGEWFYYASRREAELPVKADGSFPRITMTTVEDIGRYVAKSLDLERWETVSNFVGDTLPMDEVVRIAEDVMGEKWKIITVSPADYQKRIAEEQDGLKKLWWQLGLVYSHDAIDEGVLEPQLNQLMLDLKPCTIKEYMRKYYG